MNFSFSSYCQNNKNFILCGEYFQKQFSGDRITYLQWFSINNQKRIQVQVQFSEMGGEDYKTVN